MYLTTVTGMVTGSGLGVIHRLPLVHFQDFLNEVFLVFKDLVKSNVYPARWIVMSMLQS